MVHPSSHPEYSWPLASEVTEGQCREILHVLDEAYGQWPAENVLVDPLKHLRWKHSIADQVGLPACQTVRVDGELAIVVNLVPKRLKVFGTDRIALCLADAAVRKKWRGSGLYSEAAAVRDGHFGSRPVMQLTNTSSPSMLAVWKKRGLSLLGCPVDILLRPLSGPVFGTAGPPSESLLLPPSIASTGLRLASWCSRLVLRRTPVAGPELRLERVNRFGNDATRLFHSVEGAFDLIGVRDAEYLNWRYLDPRGGTFDVVAAHRGDVLAGYVVTTTVGSRGYLVDLVCERESPALAGALGKEALASVRNRGATSATCWLPRSHQYSRALASLGFVRTGKTVTMGFLGYGELRDELVPLAGTSSSIHYMLGDTDVV